MGIKCELKSLGRPPAGQTLWVAEWSGCMTGATREHAIGLLTREIRQDALGEGEPPEVELAELRERVAAMERERDTLIEAWPELGDDDRSAVFLASDGLWRCCSQDTPEACYEHREAAVRAAAGLTSEAP